MLISYKLSLCVSLLLLLGEPVSQGAVHTLSTISAKPQDADQLPPVPLRKCPKALSEKDAREMILRYGFYERNIHPGSDLPNQYLQIANQGDLVVADIRHKLMWAVGVQLPASADKVVEFLANLQYGGYNDWRLPTLEELASLLEPRQQTKHYYGPAFENFHFYMALSSDILHKNGKKLSWSVNFDQGTVTTVLPNTCCCLLPVRSLSTPPIRSEGGTSVRGFEKDR